jgi:short-subunit dehydrogenase
MSNKLALVTGASSGIGFHLAEELVGRGYDVVVASAGNRLQPAAQKLRGDANVVLEVQADLATREGVDKLWQDVEGLGRPVDIACINAGVGLGGLFAETDLDTELNMVALNCAGTVHLAKHVVRQMSKQGGGRILFTASIAGEMVAPREAVYAATKAFVLSFAHSLRYELRDTQITVTALQPGPTDTDFFHRAGMDNTQVGTKGKSESQPADVAREGIEALLDGKDHVYAASAKTKLEGAVANLVPGAAKGAMHEKMARPLDEKESA